MTTVRCFQPIIIAEKEKPEIYEILIKPHPDSQKIFMDATKKVLDIMLENGLTLDPNRRAVWCYHKILHKKGSTTVFKDRIGENFPGYDFEKKCNELCQEKVRRTEKNPDNATSHESRNPEKGAWGGSLKLSFAPISKTQRAIILTCTGASSGLKEWEDFALELGKYRYLGLIKFEDHQIQQILLRVEASVKNDPTAQPEGMTISEYVKKVFKAIDESLAKNI